MAVIVRRRSWGGVLPLGRHASISGSSLIHCVSVSMAPPHLRGAKRLQSEPVQARTGPRPSTINTREAREGMNDLGFETIKLGDSSDRLLKKAREGFTPP